MEIRGLGIIDVKSLYGVGATKHLNDRFSNPSRRFGMKIKYYDRLG